MKRRYVAILLAAVLVASNVPNACYMVHAQDSVQTQDVEAEATLCDVSEGNVVISENGRYKITGITTENTITVEANVEATIILNDVSVRVNGMSSPMKIDGTAKVTVILEGENELVFTNDGWNCSGVEFSDVTTGALGVEGTGSLLAQGSIYGAGIGGRNTKNITINNGDIAARAGDSDTSSSGAGIGGHINSSAENIVINGGNIRVYASWGAGIGGGSIGSADGIQIHGGTVTVERIPNGGTAAGIGGGASGDGKNITITGGTIITQGGTSSGSAHSPGIGAGLEGEADNITITGGTITILGERGIGAYNGWGYSNGTPKIVIDGGSVKMPGFSKRPVNTAGAQVYLMKVPNAGNIKTLEIDGVKQKLGGNHSEDDYLYCYVTYDDHLVRVITEEDETLYSTYIIEDENPGSSAFDFGFSVMNEWIEPLNVDDWTYGEAPEELTASARYGTSTYLYSAEQDGIYSAEVPTEAGTWYVKAKVEGTDTYLALESDPVSFQILPKSSEGLTIPEITETVDFESLVIKNGETVLVNGTDYDVHQEQDGMVVTITIQFKGNYSGVHEVSYRLNAGNDDAIDDGKDNEVIDDEVGDVKKDDMVSDDKKKDTKEENSSAVNTGDPSMLGFWGLTFALSGATLVVNRKRKKEE